MPKKLIYFVIKVAIAFLVVGLLFTLCTRMCVGGFVNSILNESEQTDTIQAPDPDSVPSSLLITP